ncbi:hypothetical protein ACWERV_27690 [Streptomyces sp. NPDC004031]
MHDHGGNGPGARQARHGGTPAGRHLTELLGLFDPAELRDLTDKEVDEVLRRLLFMFRWLLTGGPHRAEEQLRALRTSVTALEKTTARLTERLDAADRVRAGQHEQLRLMQGAVTRLQNDQQAPHRELGANWQKLLSDRGLVRLVENAAAHAPDRGWDPADQSEAAHWARVRDEAAVQRAAAELLTAREDVDRAALESLLVPAGTDGARARAELADLASRAAGLHREASQLKFRPVFDFSRPEPVVTSATAILYSPECGYGRPAASVVLPAYRLGDQRMTKPTVLTERAAPAAGRAQAAPGGAGEDPA